MITLNDCISILDQREDSAAYLRFLSGAAGVQKMQKEGYQGTQSLKKDGVYVHFEYVDRTWIVRAVHLYWTKVSGFLPFSAELCPSVTMKVGRSGLAAALGPPGATGGDGSVGRFGIVNRVWNRWDYEGYSIRFDYEEDGSSLYVGCLQRSRDVQEFEKKKGRRGIAEVN